MTVTAKKKFYSDATAKPKPLPLSVDGIPEELRTTARWIPWVFSWKPDGKGAGKWDKPPCSAKSGKVADCTAAKNWGTLRQALNWVEAGAADGVGFAMGGGFVGFDLDNHRDPETGELSAFAGRVVTMFPSYTEVSPSGTGIKIIGKGTLPPDTPKKVAGLGLELFTSGYFTLTGNVVPDAPGEVRDLQPAIDAHLSELLDLAPDTPDPATTTGTRSTAASAPTGGKIPTVDEIETRVRAHTEGERLMNGDTSDHGGDNSAADMALANLVAFYSQGRADLIDAVFRRSQLLREKWDTKHSSDGRSYGAMTVAKAIASKREFFDWADSPKATFGTAAGSPDVPLPWPTMGEAAFHGIAGELVRLIEPHTEADNVALLVQFLTMFGSAAGRNAFARVERSRHHMNEFTVLVGQSAKGRKGTSEAWPTGLMTIADEQWAGSCRAGKLASGEALVWALRDPISKMEDLVSVCVDEGVKDKRLLITEGEFSAILKIAAKEQNTLSDQLRDAWDAKDLHNKSKGSPCKATAPHVSVIAHTNDSDLRLFLSENAMANGFANRFLFFAVKRSKSLPFGGNVDEDKFAAIADRVSSCLAYARAVGEVTWSTAAAELWSSGGEYDRLSRERYGLAGALTGRAEAHTLRLAMMFALLDCESQIDLEHLQAALAVWAYAEQTAYRLFGGLTGDPLADDVLRVLSRHAAGVGRWALHQECGKNIPAARIGSAIDTLLSLGRARCEKRKSGGRDAEVWFAVSK